MSDLFGLAGTELLDGLELPGLRGSDRLPAPDHGPIGLRDRGVRQPCQGSAGPRSRLHRVRTIPGIGPMLGAVFVAEIGDITRFPAPEELTCWAGMTPHHRESDTTVRRGKITKQGSRLVRWAAVESVQRLPGHTRLGASRHPGCQARPQHRRGRRRPPATGVRLLRTTRPPRPRRPARCRVAGARHSGHATRSGLVITLKLGRCAVA